MKIALSSVMVNNQDNAKRFYTEVLGFVTKRDIPITEGLRWLTVGNYIQIFQVLA
jgi:catechol 2,3-dioxygenase-like lactoylglutathione lyase family enzyme